MLETPDDRKRYELVAGRFVVTSTPAPAHQEIRGRSGCSFYGFVERNNLGKVFMATPYVRLSPHDIVVPDFLFISHDRRAIVQPLMIDGAPDLVGEVLSLETRRLDLGEKADLYARSGVREYWWVDPPARSVTVRVFETGEETTVVGSGVAHSTVLPGFEVDVEALFSNLW